MKKKILLCLSVLILAASCGQSVINNNKESEVANQQKIVEEPFTGQTYDLNQTDLIWILITFYIIKEVYSMAVLNLRQLLGRVTILFKMVH